jgi:outer membrane protein assembly factor BamD (BamD/ComL family)
LTGCAVGGDWKEGDEMRDSLLRAQKSFARRDYPASVSEYQRVLSLTRGRRPADDAYFHLGLIHVDPDNPQKDLQRAVECFNKVITSYPESPLADQARIWVTVLDDSERAKQELETSKQVIEQSKQEIERSKQMIEKARQETEKTRQEMEKSRQVMEKSKQVDIEIEQKRRERAR